MTFLFMRCLPVLLLGLGGCGHQQWSIGLPVPLHVYVAPITNDFVFDEIGVQAYTQLWEHLARVGYTLHNSADANLVFELQVLSASSVEKFVSPDVVLAAQQMKLELALVVKDRAQKVICTQKQHILFLVQKPHDTSLVNNFLYAGYQSALEQLIPRLELAVRPAVLAYVRVPSI